MSRPAFGTKGAPGKLKGAAGNNRPEHIDREPAANIAYNKLISNCTTVDFETRATFVPLPHPPTHTTLASEFAKAALEAGECFDKVCAAVDRNGGKPFLDKSFFLGHRKNLYPDGSPDDCTVGEPKGIIRANEFLPNAPLFAPETEERKNQSEAVAVQGGTGDCFMLAAINAVWAFGKRLRESGKASAVAQAQFTNPIQRLFVKADIKRSVYAVVLYGVGEWKWVIIDGLIASNQYEEPQYSSCRRDAVELWPMLLEKAYFKFFRSVDCCDGGFTAEAICTLTGGCQMHVDLDRLKFDKLLEIGSNPMNTLATGVKGNIPQEVKDQYAAASGKRGKCGEESAVAGLTGGHAYSIVGVKKTTDGMGFVTCMNPWAGSGENSSTEDSSSEWYGPWSDKSKLWKKHPHYKNELGFKDRDDGVFFMAANDFQKLMSLEVCSFFSDRDQILTLSGVYHTNPSKATDDVLILKIDKKSHIRIILGGYSSRWAAALLGESPQIHQITKNKADWNFVTPSPKLQVNYHPKGCPTPKTWAAEAGTKKKLGERSAVWSETVFIDLDVPFEKGYISIVPEMDPGCPYYVRVVAPEDAQCTLFSLAKGLESAAGKTDIKIRIEKIHDPVPGAPVKPIVNPVVPKPPIVNPKPNVPVVVTPIVNPKPNVPVVVTPIIQQQIIGVPQQIVQAADEAEEEGDDNEWWDDDEECEEYEEGEEGEEGEEDEYEDDWYDDDEDEGNSGKRHAWEGYDDYDPETDYEDEEGEEEEEEEEADEDEVIGGMTVKRHRRNFDQFDLDGSGYLEKPEVMACFLHFFPNLRPNQMMKKLKEVDTNEDGQLSFKEYLAIARTIAEEDE